MAINQLIALGGTQNKSPIQRFIETKQMVDEQQQNRLAMQMKQQEFAQNQQANNQNSLLRQQQMAQSQQEFEIKKAESLFKAVAPVMGDIIEGKTSYEEVKPWIAEQSRVYGIPFDPNAPFNPQIATAIYNKYGEKPKQAATWVNYNGSDMNAVEKDGKYYDEVTGKQLIGAKPTVTRQATGSPEDWGLTDAGKNKVVQDRIEAEKSVYKQISVIDKIADNVAKPEFIGGKTGDAVSIVNSVAAQYRQLMGIDGLLGKDGKLDANKVDPNSPSLSRYRKGAIIKDSNEAALIELAYAAAKANDPGGRITENDYQFAKQMFAAGADKVSILNLLKNRRSSTVSEFNAAEKILSERAQGYAPSSYSEDKYKALYGKGDINTKDATNEDLFKVLIGQ
jgi:hypothetical protein